VRPPSPPLYNRNSTVPRKGMALSGNETRNRTIPSVLNLRRGALSDFPNLVTTPLLCARVERDSCRPWATSAVCPFCKRTASTFFLSRLHHRFKIAYKGWAIGITHRCRPAPSRRRRACRPELRARTTRPARAAPQPLARMPRRRAHRRQLAGGT
jgi:hypothetical protein